MRGSNLVLRKVRPEETLVKNYVETALNIFKANLTGPQKYV